MKYRLVGMIFVEVLKRKNEVNVFMKFYRDVRVKGGKLKYRVGDWVWILKYKRKVFDNGYILNWIEEIFVVDVI